MTGALADDQSHPCVVVSSPYMSLTPIPHVCDGQDQSWKSALLNYVREVVHGKHSSSQVMRHVTSIQIAQAYGVFFIY